MDVRQNGRDKNFLIVSYFVMLLGTVVCLGWFLNVSVLTSVLPGLGTMKFNTALCFMLSGAIFFLLIKKKARFAYFTLTALLLISGALLVAENLFNFDFGIDQLIIKDKIGTANGNPFPGRPSLATSLCFFLLAISFLGLKSGSKTIRQIIPHLLNVVVLFGFIALVGYIYDIPSLYKIVFFTSMALNTSLAMLALSGAIIFYWSDMGLGKLFTGNSLGSIVARRLFPQMVITILILGYLRILTHRYNLVSVESGIALYSVSFIVVVLSLIWANAKLLDRIDEKRKKAEDRIMLINENLENKVLERTAQLEETNKNLVSSNERFFTIFDNNPIGMIITDMETTKFQYVNEKFCRIFSYLKDEVVGKTSLDLLLIEPVYRDKIISLLQRQARVKDVEVLLRKMNGETFWALTSVQTMLINGKKYALTSFIDIEERKIAEEKLRKSNELFSNLFEHNPAAISIRDTKEGKLINVNTSFLKLFCYALKEDVVGYTYFQLGILADPQQGERINKQLKENKVIKDLEVEVRNRDGNMIWLVASLVLMEYDDEPCILSVSIDITERKKIENELVKAKQLADESVILKEAFLANMSHEIRTPMNAIIGFTDLMLKRNLQEPEKDYVRTIKSSGENLLRIINDILDVSKIDSGMMTFEDHPMSIKEIFDSLYTMLAQRAEEKKLKLSFEYSPGMPDRVLGDPTRLTQIILNLVGNAIKFTENGGITVFADVLDDDEEKYKIAFSVADTGIGIPPDKLENIFERFTQAEAHTTRYYGGTGLGLNIARQLIEAQGGNISVASVVGAGTTFSFFIPFKKTSETEIQTHDYSGHINTAQLANMQILVAEDNPINVKFVLSLFEEFGIRPDFAENGRITLERVRTNYYDILLLDMEMPELNGYDTTKAIRNELKNDIPIIAMTAHAMAGEKEKCIQLGMDDYISKPINADLLFKKILHITATKKRAVSRPVQNKLIKMDFIVQSMRGKKEAICNLLDVFLEQVPEDLAYLNEGVTNIDYPAIKAYAHKMISSVSLMEIDGIVPMLQEMESLAASGSGIDKINWLNQDLNLLCIQAITETQAERMHFS